jgi:diketogulonate reductase-like aldo/keto reductase
MEMYQVFVVLSLQWRLWSTNNTKWLVKRCCIACILCTSNILIAQEVSNVAKEVGCSTAQVALNWIRQQNMLLTQKNKIIPIIGSRKESQIKDNLACLEFVLSDDQMQRLNEISKIELGFPHDFLNSEMIKEIIYGGTYSSIVLKK